MAAAHCRYCGARVFFARTPSGALMPVDWTPAPDGTVVAYTSADGATCCRVLKRDEAFTGARYKAHQATCTRPPAPRNRRDEAGAR